MKKLLLIALGLMLFSLALPSCSSDTGSAGIGADNTLLYKIAIERYINAYIRADLDTVLDSLDPDGPMYPDPEEIQHLQDTAAESSLEGEASVTDLTILEESSNRARVRVTIFMRLDLYGEGNFEEDTSEVTIELTLKDGKWRLYDATEN